MQRQRRMIADQRGEVGRQQRGHVGRRRQADDGLLRHRERQIGIEPRARASRGGQSAAPVRHWPVAFDREGERQAVGAAEYSVEHKAGRFAGLQAKAEPRLASGQIHVQRDFAGLGVNAVDIEGGVRCCSARREAAGNRGDHTFAENRGRQRQAIDHQAINGQLRTADAAHAAPRRAVWMDPTGVAPGRFRRRAPAGRAPYRRANRLQRDRAGYRAS